MHMFINVFCFIILILIFYLLCFVKWRWLFYLFTVTNFNDVTFSMINQLCSRFVIFIVVLSVNYSVVRLVVND